VKLVAIVLLNWNGWRDTLECLASLQRLDYPNSRVVVVDNGSADDSVARIRKEFLEVEIMERGETLGYAKGNNAGIREALERGAEYVWLLNNDTIVAPNALRAMVQKFETHPKVGAVGSAIYYTGEPERLQAWGGGYVNFWLGRSRHYLSPIPDEKIEFLTGASLMLRRGALESVGLFDEAFFLYWEDADYCFRLRQSAWKLAVAAESKVWHKESASVGKKSAQQDIFFNRSAGLFFNKHAQVPLASFWIGTVLRLGKRAAMGDFERIRAVWFGVTGRNNASRA